MDRREPSLVAGWGKSLGGDNAQLHLSTDRTRWMGRGRGCISGYSSSSSNGRTRTSLGCLPPPFFYYSMFGSIVGYRMGGVESFSFPIPFGGSVRSSTFGFCLPWSSLVLLEEMDIRSHPFLHGLGPVLAIHATHDHDLGGGSTHVRQQPHHVIRLATHLPRASERGWWAVFGRGGDRQKNKKIDTRTKRDWCPYQVVAADPSLSSRRPLSRRGTGIVSWSTHERSVGVRTTSKGCTPTHVRQSKQRKSMEGMGRLFDRGWEGTEPLPYTSLGRKKGTLGTIGR